MMYSPKWFAVASHTVEVVGWLGFILVSSGFSGATRVWRYNVVLWVYVVECPITPYSWLFSVPRASWHVHCVGWQAVLHMP